MFKSRPMKYRLNRPDKSGRKPFLNGAATGNCRPVPLFYLLVEFKKYFLQIPAFTLKCYLINVKIHLCNIRELKNSQIYPYSLHPEH